MRRSATLLLLVCLCGCRSPEAWRRQADEAAARSIAEAQRAAFGSERPFTIERPSDTLRRRLQIPAATNGPAPAATNLVLTLADCLRVGARNSPAYQDRKELVFRSALALDLERHAFENSYSGLLSGGISTDRSSDPSEDKATGSAGVGVTRKLKSGATLSTKMSLDVVKLLTGDRESSLGALADATVTIPLMRGAGREVVTEPLTQAERNLMYALLQFERYKDEFTVGLASDCLSVLLAGQQVRIANDNLKRLEDSLARAQALGQAGRLPATEVDQTQQDLLRARQSVIITRQQAEARVDELKLSLGLPIDADVRIDENETRRVAALVTARLDASGPAPDDPAEADCIASALTRRQDLRVTRGQAEDAERQVRVAANALKAGLDVTLHGSEQDRSYHNSDTADIRFGHGGYSGLVNVDLPWERTSERNAYRNALLALDKARRDLETTEDQVKKSVREALRTLRETRETYLIQRRAVELADRRVRSTALFLEAGRAQTRDVLEAGDALVSAQNALAASVVAYSRARWALARDTGRMSVDEDGGWNMEAMP